MTARRNCATSKSNYFSGLKLVGHFSLHGGHAFLFPLLRYANTACELLTCDVSVINDKVGGDDSLLNTLYSFLEQDPPLNPLLASFFSKTFSSLISRKPEQVNRLRGTNAEVKEV